LLQFAVVNSEFSFISYDFPTSWDDDGEIEVMHDLLQLIVKSARNSGSKIVVGGDFNASIGGLRIDEDAAGFGKWGQGHEIPVVQSRPHGVKHCSKCFLKLTVLASQLIFGPLQTYA